MADLSRRSFIRWVLNSGAALAACPFPRAQAADAPPGGAPAGPGAAASELHSEGNAICHSVRDGDGPPAPKPARRCDVVIVGGGPSGLAAADELQATDFLLLEKEPHVGGNAFTESWKGLEYCTGSAWLSVFNPEVDAMLKRWRFDLKPIRGLDAVCFEGKWIPEFWNGREDNPALDQLPYPKEVADSMRRFCRELSGIDIEKRKKELDLLPFSDLMKGHAPQLKAFWDTFGPSNWGATTEHTSAYMGVDAARDWAAAERFSFEGGLGVGSRRIYEHLSESARGRIVLGATAYQVKRRGKRVLVSYAKDGATETIEAKAAVLATPKFITRHIVTDLPEAQRAAMARFRYAPYLVVNLCFDRVVYNQAYDNFVVGAKHFTDFIPADFVTHGTGGDLNRPQVLTVYCPQPESERPTLLDDKAVLAKARGAAEELTEMFPGSSEQLSEVRVYRRGHPMFMSIPGCLTKLQPAASRDLPPIYFAHSDSGGVVSDLAYAGLNGIAAARKAGRHL